MPPRAKKRGEVDWQEPEVEPFVVRVLDAEGRNLGYLTSRPTIEEALNVAENYLWDNPDHLVVVEKIVAVGNRPLVEKKPVRRRK